MCRGTDETHVAACQILEPKIADPEHLEIGARVQRVDREIAALRIGDPVVREGYLGGPPESPDVAAQGRDLH